MLDMDEKAIKDGQLVTIYDPACGSGGMLSAAKEFIEEKINPNAKVVLYGQEVNDKTWAVAQTDPVAERRNGLHYQRRHAV